MMSLGHWTLFVALLSAVGTVRAGAGEFLVSWNGGVVCVTADNAFRADVLRDVARRTGTKLAGAENLADRITQRSACADLGSTLRSLAGTGSYALTEIAPARTGLPSKYQLFIAQQGKGRPQVNLMSSAANVSVSAEDVTTGEMRPVAAPAAIGYSTTVRPDEAPASVRVDLE